MHVKSYKEDSYVECPFYINESPTEIKCEGIVGSHLVNVFKTREKKEEHKYDFCRGNYAACPIYQEKLKDEEEPL